MQSSIGRHPLIQIGCDVIGPLIGPVKVTKLGPKVQRLPVCRGNLNVHQSTREKYT